MYELMSPISKNLQTKHEKRTYKKDFKSITELKTIIYSQYNECKQRDSQGSH